MDEPLRLDRYERPADFLAAASPWLEQREAEHNLILGIGSTARDHPEMYDPPYLATVTAGERLVAAALRTPPWNLILSEVDDAGALDLLVADLADHDLPGVIAAPDVATGFALRWAATTGGRFAVGMEERIFELTEVIAPLAVSGSMRAATAEDRPLLVDWITAFGREALGEGDASRVAASVDDWLGGKGRTLWLWDDDGTVSLTGVGGETPNGTRIGPVYTPPELRGRGYASALVAAVSQAQLDAGRRFCFLYTDLANPTSNKIYQAIGYRPVTDAVRIDFRPGSRRS
jgi:predicted GNAT family acetyltransferase